MSNAPADRYRLPFASVPWEALAPGWRVKRFVHEGRVARLVELTDALAPTPCIKGHVGYVVSGRLTIELEGRTLVLEAGDGLAIPDGEAAQHVPRVAAGESALLFLVEDE